MMQSKRKWLSILLILALTLVVFSVVAHASPDTGIDNDQDGLTASQEAALGTSDNNIDSDGDGLCDGPMSATACVAWDGGTHGGEDLDADGVVDANETDPANPDTDGDGMKDGWEWVWGQASGTAPQWLADMYNSPFLAGQNVCGVTDPLDPSDAANDDEPAGPDLLSNKAEHDAGANPCRRDTDSDTIIDGNEADPNVWGGKTDPANPDSDGDGLCDGFERNTGVFYPGLGPIIESNAYDGDNVGYQLYMGDPATASAICQSQAAWALTGTTPPGNSGTDPNNPDTDGDGVNDGREATGIFNEWGTGTNPRGYVSDPLRQDTDFDGLNDYYELTHGMDPTHKDTDGDGLLDPDEVNSCSNPAMSDANADHDGDGLATGVELGAGLDPCNVDTDGDGLNDGWEYYYNHTGNCVDPLVADANADGDMDGLSNAIEYFGLDATEPLTHTNSAHSSNPYASEYMFTYPPAGDGTDPCNYNTDGDSFSDGYEYWVNKYAPVDENGDSLNKCTDTNGFDPITTTVKYYNPDGDKDYGAAYSYGTPEGLLNYEEYVGADGVEPPMTTTVPIDFDSPIFMAGEDTTSACVADTDQGGVDDGHEKALGLNPLDPADDNFDRDGDGIPDAIEDSVTPDGHWDAITTTNVITETNFADPDTDKDGLCDGGVNANGEYPGADGILDDDPDTLDDESADNYLVQDGTIYEKDALNAWDFDHPVCVAGEDRDNDGTIVEEGPDGFITTTVDNETDPIKWDTDDDGMRDGWEVLSRDENGDQCMNPNMNDASEDPDGDGLTNTVEHNGINGTWDSGSGNPNSNHDGAWVGADNNGDDEYTNPCKADTDGGGAEDGWEWTSTDRANHNGPWKDPLDPADDMDDTDWDGIPDVIEDSNHNGNATGDYTNWLSPDTDGDALCDGDASLYASQVLTATWNLSAAGQYSWYTYTYEANVPVIVTDDGEMYRDMDGDGVVTSADKFICRGGEDLNGDGKIAGDENDDRTWGTWDDDNDTSTPEVFEQWQETAPDKADTDGDTLCDGAGGNEFVTSTGDPCANDKVEDGFYKTNPLDADSDNDQLDDAFEVSKSITNTTCYNPLKADSDGDGLWDGYKPYDLTYQQQTGTYSSGHGYDASWDGFDGDDNAIGTADDEPGEDIDRDGVQDTDETDPCAADSDADGVDDGFEYQYFESPRYGIFSTDWDSLYNLRIDTDMDYDGKRPALDSDSDNDGAADGYELDHGTNPMDPTNTTPPPGPQPGPQCPWDLDASGFVDLTDINIEISHSIFNPPYTYNPAYDFNTDNVVDIVDIQIVANHVGPCP